MTGRKKLSTRLPVLRFLLWYFRGTVIAVEVDGGRAVIWIMEVDVAGVAVLAMVFKIPAIEFDGLGRFDAGVVVIVPTAGLDPQLTLAELDAVAICRGK
jgi:hypothetical protein